MKTLSETKQSSTLELTSDTKISDWYLAGSIAVLIVVGSFTYSIYPPPVNAAALVLMIGLFYYPLHKHDPVTFFIQLFIGNFFTFGNAFGGNYNIAAFAAVVFYSAVNGKMFFLNNSVLNKSIKSALIIWCVFDLLSVFGGNSFSTALEIQNFLAFAIIIYIFFFVSRIPLTETDIQRFLFSISIFAGYEFLVALNQRYAFFNSPFPFFPSNGDNIEFYMDIVRSFSTLNNYESFAEYCVSLITLLIPAVLSGTMIKKSKPLYYVSIVAMLLSVISIVFSGTRSSMGLLPLAIIIIGFALGKRLNRKIVISLIVGLIFLIVVNGFVKIVDYSVFAERTDDMDVEHLTLESVLNGDAINRGGLFPYAMERVRNTGIIGTGYFTSLNEYHVVHFGNEDLGVADYHNLYMSAYVMFGLVGFLCMMFVFAFSIYKGWKLYWKIRYENHLLIDVLLGCNVLFMILMINQFKIQMVREINYFTLMMILLSFYNVLFSILDNRYLNEQVTIQKIKVYNASE